MNVYFIYVRDKSLADEKKEHFILWKMKTVMNGKSIFLFKIKQSNFFFGRFNIVKNDEQIMKRDAQQ